MERIIINSGRRYGKTYESIMLHITMLNRAVIKLTKRVNELEKQLKDIDMDLNDIFDDVEGKHEDSDK